MRSKAEHLVLARPLTGVSRQAGNADPVWSRPSTAALTRLGARKASEIVILTWRMLHRLRGGDVSC